jgi:hypothetical protein
VEGFPKTKNRVAAVVTTLFVRVSVSHVRDVRPAAYSQTSIEKREAADSTSVVTRPSIRTSPEASDRGPYPASIEWIGDWKYAGVGDAGGYTPATARLIENNAICEMIADVINSREPKPLRYMIFGMLWFVGNAQQL